MNKQRGVTIAEFALVLLPLMLLLFGIIETGRLFWTYASLNHALEESVRRGMVQSLYAYENPAAHQSDLEAHLRQQAQALGLATERLTVSTQGSLYAEALSAAEIQIQVEYQFQFLTGVFGVGSMTLRRESTVNRREEK